MVVVCMVGLGCGAATTGGDGGSGTDGSSSTGAVTTTAPDPDTSGGPAATASATTGASDTSEGDTTADPSSTGEPAFELDAHTLLTGDGRLALQCNLPRDVTACEALGGDPPCEDADADELVDAWEDVALQRLHPLRRFDEAESAIDDATAVLADVGRVAPVADGVHLYVMLGYSRDYGSCGGFTGHEGDSERVAIDLEDYAEGGPGGVVMRAAYTAAHEGTVNDHGQVFAGGDLSQLVFGPDPESAEPRWIVFPSADKHATYATVDICENVSIIPCVDEDCAPDGVGDPSLFDALPPIVNAGEETAPRVDDLTDIGFPGDFAWARQDFCGGLGGSNCSAPVRDKLLVDPF